MQNFQPATVIQHLLILKNGLVQILKYVSSFPQLHIRRGTEDTEDNSKITFLICP